MGGLVFHTAIVDGVPPCNAHYIWIAKPQPVLVFGVQGLARARFGGVVVAGDCHFANMYFMPRFCGVVEPFKKCLRADKRLARHNLFGLTIVKYMLLHAGDVDSCAALFELRNLFGVLFRANVIVYIERDICRKVLLGGVKGVECVVALQ